MNDTRHCRLAFHGATLLARADGALHWPEQDALIVADLHLGKPERLARRGGALIPPYGDAETLARLSRALAETGAARVFVLGDAFDDTQARLATQDADRLMQMLGRHEWHWIAGNHDPVLPARWGGARTAFLRDLALGPLVLRHVAMAGAGPDVSGHYHPAVRLAGARRPAFMIGAQHLILPAFGAYTGGLDGADPVLAALVPQGRAVLTGPQAVVVPWPLPTKRKRGQAAL